LEDGAQPKGPWDYLLTGEEVAQFHHVT
jgi:hypothetical protein